MAGSRSTSRMLTASEVADRLHVHINTVRRWSNQGMIKAYRIGPRGDRRFMEQDITNFVQEFATNHDNRKVTPQ